MSINPQEKKRLLQRRAKRELEAAGYGLKKLQGGGFLVIDGESENVLAQFETIEQLGQVLGLWGKEIIDSDLADELQLEAVKDDKLLLIHDRDPKTKLDTPTTAAIREKGR